ncbi:MAG: GHMP kinase [Promethearchaeota archaeon]|nr:MAG: GHMP kinase [Candidatus Lokiarchaeota archaeon]
MIKIRAPGRICLFGEHQDYLDYPVIAMAISKYIYLKAKRISEPLFIIELPDTNEFLEIKLDHKELEYESGRDYLKSGYNQFLRRDVIFNKGYKIKIQGDIPIGAGVSSSSALVMAWLSFLNLISNLRLDKNELANEGYNAEVREFNEAGGKMDFFTSIYGNLVYLDLQRGVKVTHFKTDLNGFILGNSLDKKNTVDDLLRVKNTAIEAFNILSNLMPDFNKYETSLKEIQPYLPNLEKKYQKSIEGNIKNRDITLEARELILNNLSLLRKNNAKSKIIINFYTKLGILLNQHHAQLDKNIEVSTPKINKMINKCVESGAIGGKINGSGFGGTMFALAIGNEEKIAEVIKEMGGKAFQINTSQGINITCD